MLRPEKLKVVAAADGAGLNVFAGEVKELVYQGESSLLYVSLADGQPIAIRQPQVARTLPRTPGAPILLGLAPGDTISCPRRRPDGDGRSRQLRADQDLPGQAGRNAARYRPRSARSSGCWAA